MKILDSWINDLPQQFLDRHNIEVLIKAFSDELQEVNDMFEQLNELTDLDTAVGKNLDMVGDIINLSRKDALSILLEKDVAMTDELYRNALRYQNLKNTCECTYYDIMETINLMWNVNQVDYYEDPEHPATICLILPTVGLDDPDPLENRIMVIKPGGVGVLYFITYVEKFYFPIRYDFGISMRVEWGAREARKFLDGSWYLDGSEYLSGTEGESYESNPVNNIYFRMENPITIASDMPTPEYVFPHNIQLVINPSKIWASMEHEALDLAQEMAVKVTAEANQAVGFDVAMRNDVFLDGAWMLDGTRSLEGGYITV